jgi:hypothetical protein
MGNFRLKFSSNLQKMPAPQSQRQAVTQQWQYLSGREL